MNDVLGAAISDFFYDRKPAKLWVIDDYGPKVEMNIATYFRDEASMPDLEFQALENCRGDVLDIGAGAGSHALALQQRGLRVTALDISPGNVSVMKDRGVENVVFGDIYAYNNATYDTLLLLMNGIGLTANITGLRRFLQHAKTLLNPGGQLLFDSSDVAYLYEEEGILPVGHYYGEIRCWYSYKGRKTEPFTWLYIDRKTLTAIAREEGWDTTIIAEDDDDQYLARLIRIEN